MSSRVLLLFFDMYEMSVWPESYQHSPSRQDGWPAQPPAGWRRIRLPLFTQQIPACQPNTGVLRRYVWRGRPTRARRAFYDNSVPRAVRAFQNRQIRR